MTSIKENTMEAILVDVRRFYRAVLDALVAKRQAKVDALRASESESYVAAVARNPQSRARKVMVRTGGEEYEMYRRVTFDKMPPL